MEKKRLDMLLVLRGLAESREKAKALIMAGEVTVDGQLVDRPSATVPSAARIAVKSGLPYVSRGGLKLEHALREFGLDVRDLVIVDVGASTGGFTDCLLKHGASRVYAVDVGYGQLAWRLRQDPRVVVHDRTNIRYLSPFPEEPDAAVVDVSFISLRLVLRKVMDVTKAGAWIVALIKPQFEAGRAQVGKGGVVRDPAVQRQVLVDVLGWTDANGLAVCGLTVSPLLGPAGNREYLAYLRKKDTFLLAECADASQRAELIEASLVAIVPSGKE